MGSLMAEPVFNIVLLSPQIPNNTGNIGRTAMATGCRLHIIHPIAFEMDEKAVRRAGFRLLALARCSGACNLGIILEA